MGNSSEVTIHRLIHLTIQRSHPLFRKYLMIQTKKIPKRLLSWVMTLGAQWKNEEPPQPEPSTEPKSEPDLPFYLGKSLREPKKRKQKPPKSVSQKQRAAHERDAAASRPYYQFFAQVSLEREGIVDDLSGVVDIDTQAHISVKNRWVERGIWNSSWTDIPDPKWMHEDEREGSNSLVANPAGGPSRTPEIGLQPSSQ
ncbi:hypothetical protein LOZ12_005099 [Ophidiomyces ophidiicola]|uniref:Uncharacterized protein n=1 Tax=Ophidiomyces ophidiicola TaxID=1387563 RepID=A0ACB8UNC1_9EURO|nr:hypothetical protein LOZ64_005404 [Ophidiomyces ophidiicola]KAI1938232.1 hypothetical protein LOZ62_005353 [Ophidiomyces ophidiicola]KAI1965669.1 hypothetical protein LOZ56_006029 [Ophidiomyces ophidiicola]KAI2002019.1 hypothetical protein LOZ50_005283 [Ophidiomyces ophidiicola]KAI2014808.1 hypothetical protein LOZ46_005423 [Ophidiomyces ophidiicola]